MKIPPYLPACELSPGMNARPVEPFFIRPRDYRVVDGDTFMVLAPAGRSGERREEAFRIRLFSVNTPEKPKKRGSDAYLRRAGIDPYADSAGHQATLLVRDVCKGRALFIEPARNDDGRLTDRYGRLLANVSLSGAIGENFNTDRAFALAPYLIRRGYAHPMQGKEVPPDVPETIWRLNRQLTTQREMGIAPSF